MALFPPNYLLLIRPFTANFYSSYCHWLVCFLDKHIHQLRVRSTCKTQKNLTSFIFFPTLKTNMFLTLDTVFVGFFIANSTWRFTHIDLLRCNYTRLTL